VKVGTIGSLEQILHGPSTAADGSMNLMGALRRSMATAGYSDLKEFQRVEVVVAPVSRPRGEPAANAETSAGHP
jgi:IMP dehydrogenase